MASPLSIVSAVAALVWNSLRVLADGHLHLLSSLPPLACRCRCREPVSTKATRPLYRAKNKTSASYGLPSVYAGPTVPVLWLAEYPPRSRPLVIWDRSLFFALFVGMFCIGQALL